MAPPSPRALFSLQKQASEQVVMRAEILIDSPISEYYDARRVSLSALVYKS